MQSRYCGRRETASGAWGHMLIRATSMPLHKQGMVPLLRSFGPQVRDDKKKSSVVGCCIEYHESRSSS